VALKLADFQSPDPSPAYSSLFKLDHTRSYHIYGEPEGGGDDGFAAGCLTTTNIPEKPVNSKSGIGKSNYRKKNGNSDKWTNILSSIARWVSTKKPLKISAFYASKLATLPGTKIPKYKFSEFVSSTQFLCSSSS
jgi:hypothetical protein